MKRYLKALIAAATLLIVCQGCTQRSGTEQQEGGVALSFDDRFIAEWHALRPLFREYNARVTFYITGDSLSAQEIGQLRDLANDGHEIGFHGTIHGNARQMVKELGIPGYLKTEIEPGMNYLRSLGFHPTSYAHPGGANTNRSDSALLAYGFVNLRDVAKTERYFRGVRLYHVPPVYMPQIYYTFNRRRKLRALQIDIETPLKKAEIQEALQKAKDDRSVLMLFGHQPLPETPGPGAYGFDIGFLTYILESGSGLGLRFYTMSELR